MTRRSASAAALLSLVLVAACDLPFLPDQDWKDVTWRLTTVDGARSSGDSFTRPVGAYVYEGAEGAIECAVEASFRDSEPWGRVENGATGEVRHQYPEAGSSEGPPYHFMWLFVEALCGADRHREWYFAGVVGGDFGIEGDDLAIRSIYMWDGYLNGAPADPAGFGEWVTLALPERVALASWMDLPLELTLRHRSPDGATVLAEISDTVRLRYVRKESFQ